MAKKTIAQKFRDFLDAAPAESNKPMTKGEIARTVAKKKRKAASKKGSSKSPARKKAAPKKSKKPAKKTNR
jgi:hypothetical protein